MGTLDADWGKPATKLSAPYEVVVFLLILVGLTTVVRLLGRRLDAPARDIGRLTALRRVLLGYWPPNFVSGFAQFMFYFYVLGSAIFYVSPLPWWAFPIGRLRPFVLDIRFGLLLLALYFLARAQLRPVAPNSRTLSSVRSLLMVDVPVGFLSWCATLCLALQVIFSAALVGWYSSGTLPMEFLLGIPEVLLVTYVWALEERRRPTPSGPIRPPAEVPSNPIGAS
jgi:hypothetical protein